MKILGIDPGYNIIGYGELVDEKYDLLIGPTTTTTAYNQTDIQECSLHEVWLEELL